MFDSKTLIQSLTEQPGVYRMLAADGAVLYVGKAKSLKKRVASYFQRNVPSPRIQLMLQQVAQVETTVTRSEAEALLLENNLIKSLAPKYNILFRDDKSYPYIMLSGDKFSRLAFHRGARDKSARSFGPFPNSGAVRESIQLLQRIFLLRTCENPVFNNRSRPCLLHQIKRCSAPCVGKIELDAYATQVRLAELFLNGQPGEVVDQLTVKMQQAAENLDFEHATLYRDQIRSLQNVLHRQFVSSEKEEDNDVLAVMSGEGFVCVNLAMVRGGRHLGDRTHFPHNAQLFSASEVLAAFIGQHYLDHPPPRMLLVNQALTEELQAVANSLEPRPALHQPRNEKERAWLAMAEKNALLALQARAHDGSRTQQRLLALQETLNLPDIPARIECFDVSHTMGEATVASCVVFAGDRMKNGEYRRYNLHGITPGDDYAAMRQVLTRRYEKVAAGEGVCPDLILIDGGKGQLNIAHEVMVDLGLENLPLVGVAKGQGRKPGAETLVFADERVDLQLGAESLALLLIQEIRDEAHRFAIAGHRARRAKTRNVSRLEDIPGIGPARRKRLLAQFGGMAGLVAATVEDLCQVNGISRKLAQQIHSRLH